MKTDLIYDVGMHTGEDTDYYLKKGFRVVAIEANPHLVAGARVRFADALADGSLVIVDKAIAANNGIVRFAVNTVQAEWGTISTDYARRNEAIGATSDWMDVPCTTFTSVLREHGIPYYLKIDIEGADALCIEALGAFDEKPAFVSAELTLFSFGDFFDVIAKLWCQGYRRFKIVNQALNPKTRCPNPAREGRYVDYRFGPGTSGLFGDETAGDWLSVDAVLDRARRLMRLVHLHSPSFGRLRKTRYSHWFRLLYEKLNHEPIAWYDLHAAREPSVLLPGADGGVSVARAKK